MKPSYPFCGSKDRSGRLIEFSQYFFIVLEHPIAASIVFQEIQKETLKNIIRQPRPGRDIKTPLS